MSETEGGTWTADLIIKGGTVVPMTPGSEPIRDGAVAVRGGEIVGGGAGCRDRGGPAARRSTRTAA